MGKPKIAAGWFRYTPDETVPVEAQNVHLGVVQPGEPYQVPDALVAAFAASPDWTACDPPNSKE